MRSPKWESIFIFPVSSRSSITICYENIWVEDESTFFLRCNCVLFLYFKLESITHYTRLYHVWRKSSQYNEIATIRTNLLNQFIRFYLSHSFGEKSWTVFFHVSRVFNDANIQHDYHFNNHGSIKSTNYTLDKCQYTTQIYDSFGHRMKFCASISLCCLEINHHKSTACMENSKVTFIIQLPVQNINIYVANYQFEGIPIFGTSNCSTDERGWMSSKINMSLKIGTRWNRNFVSISCTCWSESTQPFIIKCTHNSKSAVRVYNSLPLRLSLLLHICISIIQLSLAFRSEK